MSVVLVRSKLKIKKIDQCFLKQIRQKWISFSQVNRKPVLIIHVPLLSLNHKQNNSTAENNNPCNIWLQIRFLGMEMNRKVKLSNLTLGRYIQSKLWPVPQHIGYLHGFQESFYSLIRGLSHTDQVSPWQDKTTKGTIRHGINAVLLLQTLL